MIIINNEELLKRPCEDASLDEAKDIVAQLESELKNSEKLGRPGIGLAAPQIGILKNVAIVRMGKEFNTNLVNCKIKNGYDQAIFSGEGCLSFPGRVENTLRYQEIELQNNLMFPNSFIATGLFAVVIQHELDHIDGILLTDRAIVKPSLKLGPNELCFCNSLKKFKKCCGKNG